MDQRGLATTTKDMMTSDKSQLNFSKEHSLAIENEHSAVSRTKICYTANSVQIPKPGSVGGTVTRIGSLNSPKSPNAVNDEVQQLKDPTKGIKNFKYISGPSFK